MTVFQIGQGRPGMVAQTLLAGGRQIRAHEQHRVAAYASADGVKTPVGLCLGGLRRSQSQVHDAVAIHPLEQACIIGENPDDYRFAEVFPQLLGPGTRRVFTTQRRHPPTRYPQVQFGPGLDSSAEAEANQQEPGNFF